MSEIKFNMLEINLSTGENKLVDVTDDMRQFTGGRGLGAKLVWDRVPAGADPLSPENVLLFGIGPLTGLMGSVTNVSALSPLTLRQGEANMNGHFGVEMIYAGYNGGILLTGKAPKPVYIYVKNDTVEIRDASHLWGRYHPDSQETLREEIKKELDDQNFRIASIGPAGEHLVRNASIDHDLYHHASRLGMGAVMGSKNVKMIALKGTKQPPYQKPEQLFRTLLQWNLVNVKEKVKRRRWGHGTSMPERYYTTTEGIKNKQLGWDPICDLSNPLKLEQGAKLWSDACNLCHVGCKVPYMRRLEGLSPTTGEMRHDNGGGWNANVMIPGYDVQTYLSTYVDTLGLDSQDVSGVVAWMMECYDRGIISREDLGGIDLTWGNLEAICQLLKKIAFREGIGDQLAEGMKLAPDLLKKAAKQYAMTSKGVGITSYEPRGSMAEAVALAVCAVGELHAQRGAPVRSMFDSLTTCAFLRGTIPNVFGSVSNWARIMLSATSGWELSDQDWEDQMLRQSFMERCLCIREGYVPTRDDTLPERFFTETIYSKYGEPKILDRDNFLETRKKAYFSYGLTAEGIPPRQKLEELGMGFVLPTLTEKLGSW